MYRDGVRYSDNIIDNDINNDIPVKSRSERLMEAKRAFAGGTSDRQYRIENEETTTNEKRHPFGMLRLMAAGMLFLILGIAFYNNFSYKGFDKEYVLECLEKSEYWDSIVENVGDMAKSVTTWYNSVNH